MLCMYDCVFTGSKISPLIKKIVNKLVKLKKQKQPSRVLHKKGVLKNLPNSRENACSEDSFNEVAGP